MSNEPLLPFDPSKPNIARAYDHILGGKDNFAVDRELTEQILRVFPLAGVLARENRMFLARAVDYVSRQGVLQFLDVGSGLPTSPNTHEVAWGVNSDARVVYVDNDPVVIVHARALLAASGKVSAVPGDVRRPNAILTSPDVTALIDLNEPACVILTMILHFLEPAEAADIVAAFVRELAPGSFLVLSVGFSSAPSLADQVISAYTAGGLHVHDREQIAGYFAGLDLVQPGLTEARRWRPEHPDLQAQDRPADLLAGVGRKVA